MAEEFIFKGVTVPDTAAPHRWSGWPGAWCLDCGREDHTELAIACGHFDPYKGEWLSDAVKAMYDFSPCKEPGSKRHDPYAKAKAEQCAS